MVKVQEIHSTEVEGTYKVQLFADTKDEVADATIVGLPTGSDIAMGSSILTAAGEIAFMKSDGTWNWVGEEEEE